MPAVIGRSGRGGVLAAGATRLATYIEVSSTAEPPAWHTIRAAAISPIPTCRSLEVRFRTEVSFFLILALPLRSTRGWDQLRYGAQCASSAATAVNWGTRLANFSPAGHNPRRGSATIGARARSPGTPAHGLQRRLAGIAQ